jgi:hypothetical protein
MLRYATSVVAIVCLVAFFASKQPVAVARPAADLKALVAQLHEKPLSDELRTELINGGLPALDFLLDDFSRSEFVRTARTKLAKGFNLGKAMDEDPYTRNVIEATEAFGPIGVARLVRRLPPEVVQTAGLQTPEFYSLGIGTIKPLLTVHLLGGANEKQVREWITTFADERKLSELPPEQANLFPFLAGILTGVACNALWDGLKWAYHKVFTGRRLDEMLLKDRATMNQYWLSQLSPQARTRALLRQLNPQQRIPNLDEGIYAVPAIP